MRLEGKVAIVTGAAQGLGAAIAKRFAEEGATVVLTDIKGETGRATAAAIPGALFFDHDVSDEASWRGVVDETLSRFGRLDILVNNAAIVRLATIEDMSLDDFRLHERVNLESVFLGCKLALPPMISGGGGSIVNISALAGLKGVGLLPAYCAVKEGINGLTRSVSAHCFERGYGIRVNAVAPGAHDTPMVDQGIERMGDDPGMAAVLKQGMGKPVDVANLVLFLASNEAIQMNGQVVVIDNGVSSR